MDETVYIGQGSKKSRVNSHKESKLNFNKIRFSFVDDLDDRYFWERTLIDQFSKNEDDCPITISKMVIIFLNFLR